MKVTIRAYLREGSATLAEIAAALGRTKHSVNAGLDNLRKEGAARRTARFVRTATKHSHFWEIVR